jgi:uncharacterized membrane protein
MTALHSVFLIAALVCFILAAVNATVPRINLLGAGLAFWIASVLLV